MPSSGHRKLVNAASTRSGLAIHKMSTARRGKTPAKIANRQPTSSSSRLSVSLRVRMGEFGAVQIPGHHPEGVNRVAVGQCFRVMAVAVGLLGYGPYTVSTLPRL